MSFLRPEAVAALSRWAEAAAAAVAVALAGWWGVAGVAGGSVLGWFALGAGALGLFWLRAAVLGALAARPVTGAGVAIIREREIGYMGPHHGGFLELDDIERVEIYLVPGTRNPVWRLVGGIGEALAIPADAEGANRLPEALSALPGFSDLAAVGILQRADPGRHVVWARGPGKVTEFRRLR
ncbi:MAG TPA: hypothetical protein VLA52_04705 [Thermohalobaculum sp.]|nr:hypothetical protein [Thermohalobaculum sp.]